MSIIILTHSVQCNRFPLGPHVSSDLSIQWRRVMFQGNITAQGKLLYHGALRCAKNPNGNNRLKNAKYKDRYVFLFEHAVIFTTEEPGKKKNSTPLYVYKTHAPVGRPTRIAIVKHVLVVSANYFLRIYFLYFLHASRHIL